MSPDPTRPPAQPKPGEKPTCGQFRSGMNGTNMTWDVVGTTIPALVRNLSAMLGRTIIDQTGVTEPVGALHLEFVPPRFEDSLDAPGPSIFNALQEQAGLKLQSGKAPVQMLVVDTSNAPRKTDREVNSQADYTWPRYGTSNEGAHGKPHRGRLGGR